MSFGYFSRKVLAALATLAFVVCFNFFLFRVVESDPVATLFRGRNLTPTQRLELRREFGLDGSKREQFVRYLQQTAQLNFGRSYRSNQPVGVRDRRARVADDRPRRRVDGAVGVLRDPDRDRRGVARRSKADYGWTGFSMATYSMPDFWLGMLLLVTFAVTLGWFRSAGSRTRAPTRPASRSSRTRHITCSCRR